MKIVTLMENTSCSDAYRHAHGLSLYLETKGRRILFDTGPNAAFWDNAEKLGIDLEKTEFVVLSHGHYDHGGGLPVFLKRNSRAKVWIHPGAFGSYYSLGDGTAQPVYIGLNRELKKYGERFIWTEPVTKIDDGILLFAQVPHSFGGISTGARLMEKLPDGTFRADRFHHEQNLLITEGSRAVVIAGCAHRGIVNIREGAAALLGREPDVMVGGFHLFELSPDDPETDRLIDRIGMALAEGTTIYYTGHCTGEYAYARLKKILGGRLHRISSGAAFDVS